MDSDEYLLLSDVQRYAYCEHRFQLSKMGGYFGGNRFTTIGTHLHKKTDEVIVRETRGNKFISRGLEVVSHELKIRGRLDTVEFYRDDVGVKIPGREGLWVPLVCEYKKTKGMGGKERASIMQLVAQILCLEEMLGVILTKGVIIDRGHGNKREVYDIKGELKDEARGVIRDMWDTYTTKTIPPPVYQYRKCTGCSLYNYCLPKLDRGD